MKAILSVLAAMFLVSACGTKKNGSHDGYAHLRQLPVIKPKFSEELTINYHMYALSESAGICYAEINPKNLLSKRDSLDHWSRKASFQIAVKRSSFSKEILFQGEKSWIFEGDKPFIDSFRFELPKYEDVWLEITYSDLNKHTFFQEQRWWIRKKKLMQQHFALMDSSAQTPLIQAYCKCDTVKLQSHFFDDSVLNIQIYRNLDKIAPAPFAVGTMGPDFQKPDSVFPSKFTNNRLEIPLQSGFLLLKKSGRLDEVAGFFTYSEDQLFNLKQCMGYICSAAEVEKLADSSQAQQVFDQFWSKASGNDKDKCERLKKEFIRRIEYANQHFSSFKLGSLTDRGMIYLVFGEPERMLKEGFQEIWTYKSSGIDHTNFVFIDDQQQIAPNNCYLERSAHYKSSYYIAVENWRNGLIAF